LVDAKLNDAILQRTKSDSSVSIPFLSVNSISDKIKLIAERKSYLGTHNVASGQSAMNAKVLVNDKFEDDTPHYMWRWEVSTVIILPDNLTAEVKRARSARKKLASHYKAIVRLLQAVEKTQTDKGDIVKKQVTDAEERVLKFEREEEVKRLQEQERESARLAQQNEKEEKWEEAKRKREEERRCREEERVAKKAKKEEEKKVKEDTKRKAKEEKEAEEREEARLLEEKKQKQQKLMASFFTAPPPASPKKLSTIPVSSIKSEARLETEESSKGGECDRHSFWKIITSEPGISMAELRKGLSRKSKQSRRSRERTSRTVDVSVTVTVAPPPGTSGGFGDDGYYSERTTIAVPNKLKFLKFHEDFRPAYRGTWRKDASKFVTGRRPLGKDTKYLDYDVDSEAEWEEEEDGVDAEDLGKEDDEMEEDEEPGMDSRNYNFADGWLANDDEIEAEDDEGGAPGKTKKYKRRQNQDGGFSSWCIVGSGPEWTPSRCPSLTSETSTDEKDDNMLLGVSSAEAMAMLQSHSMQVYMPGLVIDMNPRKTEPMKEKAPSKEETTSADKVKKHEINSEDLETFCHFVHGSSLTSKDKVVEEFRLANPKVICSRAELQRKLDVMSNKHKCLDGGALWEVRKEALATFGLTIQLKVCITVCLSATCPRPFKTPNLTLGISTTFSKCIGNSDPSDPPCI
jgi:hypothetical protein